MSEELNYLKTFFSHLRIARVKSTRKDERGESFLGKSAVGVAVMTWVEKRANIECFGLLGNIKKIRNAQRMEGGRGEGSMYIFCILFGPGSKVSKTHCVISECSLRDRLLTLKRKRGFLRVLSCSPSQIRVYFAILFLNYKKSAEIRDFFRDFIRVLTKFNVICLLTGRLTIFWCYDTAF